MIKLRLMSHHYLRLHQEIVCAGGIVLARRMLIHLGPIVFGLVALQQILAVVFFGYFPVRGNVAEQSLLD